MVAMQAEHSLRKTTQRMNTDHGPSTSQPANEATLTMKDHVFGQGTTTSTSGNPKKFGTVKLKKQKKEKSKVDSKELVMCTLVKNKHKTMIGGHKKIMFWWSMCKKGRKGLSKGKNTFSEGDSRTLLQDRRFRQGFAIKQRKE